MKGWAFYAGLKAAAAGEGVGKPVSLLLSLDHKAANPAAEAALNLAGPCQAISLGVEVEPSTAPAALVLLMNGEVLPQRPMVGRIGLQPLFDRHLAYGMVMDCLLQRLAHTSMLCSRCSESSLAPEP